MMLAKLSATATSRQSADSTRMTAARPLMSFINSSAQCQNLLVALGGGEEHLPQRLELGLGLDDVVADRRYLFHQLGMVGGRQVDDLAALLGPGLALADQEIE